jgi:hypothetical protein
VKRKDEAKWGDYRTQRTSLEIYDALSRYATPLEEWNHELTALLKDSYAHRAAVELVRDQHFDGHPIHFLDLEAELTETARTIESAIAMANEYLKRRAEFHGAETNGGACESNPAIALESIKASASGQRAAPRSCRSPLVMRRAFVKHPACAFAHHHHVR